jgi:hypothetical protein
VKVHCRKKMNWVIKRWNENLFLFFSGPILVVPGGEEKTKETGGKSVR